MKRFTLFCFALLACMASWAQSALPTFSTAADPVYYSVKFKGGGAYLSDQGTSSVMKTVASAGSDNEKFIFIGSAESCKMKSKAGNWVKWNGSRFATSANEGDAVELTIVNGSADEYWEISRKANTSSAMNQWGGTGAGKQLGEWQVGDTNNQLYFLLQQVIMPTFSTADGSVEQYYFLKFNVCGQCVSVNKSADDNTLRLYPTDPTDAQLWKLVGTASNFQIQNKDGRYVSVGTTSMPDVNGGQNPNPLIISDTEYAGGFSLQEAPNQTNGRGFEIIANEKSGNKVFNHWGGSTHNENTIGFWQTNDRGGVISFVRPEDMTYPDYKSTGIAGYVPEHALTLWYTEPATTAPLYSGGQGYSNWMEYSLPLGNGQFGASLFGGIWKDEIQFNEKSLWSGKSTDNGGEYGDYENFGSVYAEDISGTFDFSSIGGAKDYMRQLDLTTAMGKVTFSSNDNTTKYTREYLCSNPAEAIVARYTADRPGQISLRFTMASGKPGIKATTTYADGQGTFSGKLETVSYNARFKVSHTGGTLTTNAEGVEVVGADEVVLYIAGATDFDPSQPSFISNTAGLAAKVQARVNDAAARSWDELVTEHVSDHQHFFNRVDFQLAGTKNEVPTNELINSYNKGTGENALMLEQLYFAYGRYLEIASSRGVDLPSNLQGIWNNMSEPAWNADIHSNINVQMNYWPAEPTNLSEMHLPFLNYIRNMAVDHTQWQGYAAAAGQSRGWTCYTENNIFGGVGGFMHNYVIANAWYATHLWQHYRYTLDKDYLLRVFPAMLSASQFWMDRLKLAADGTYEAPMEYSPEHGPNQDGVAHAQQLVAELFSNTLDAIEVLGDEAAVTATDLADLQEKYNKLDKGLATEVYDGQWGAECNGLTDGSTILREWKYSTYTAGANGHRHMSHLMCMYPFSQVHPGTALFDAAVNSMTLRGDGATGWSMGWKINLWARALDGDHARTILNNALAHSNGGAGVFYNLFDSHAPFQIDGNFGACAGIAEMIMQSNSDTIRVLPALPSAWSEGHMNGLKAVKDFTVSVSWKDGKPAKVTIVNNQGQTIPVILPELEYASLTVNGTASPIVAGDHGEVILSGAAGTVSEFTFDYTKRPTAVNDATTATSLDVSVSGREVTLSGIDVKSVNVYDLSGRHLKATDKARFSLANVAGQAFIIKAEARNGKEIVCKLVMK